MDLQQFGLTGLISWPAWSGLPGWTCDVERMLWAIFGLLAACFVWSTKGFIIGDNRRTHRPLNAPDFTEHATNLSGFPNTLKPHPLVNRDRHTSAALPIASTEVFRDLEDQHNVKYGPPSKFVASNSCPILFEPPKTREKAFPNRVPCRLSLCLEHPQGTPIRHEHNEIFSLEWLNGDTFSRSIEVAEDYVTQVAGDLNRTEAESARKVSWYRKSLQYCIVELVHKAPPTNWLETMDRTGWGRGGSVNATEIKRHSQNIERDGEWSENLPQSLTRLFGTERRPTFLLDIELCCTIFESHPSDLCKRSSCAKDIRQLLFDKKIRLDPDKQETAEGKEWFIPKGFLEHLFSCDLVEHLINQDEGLSHDPIWCEAMQKSNGTVKGEFVRHVHLFCIRLLASIILAELDLRCLYYLWIDSKAATKESIGIRDANIPLNRANRPHGERYAKIDEGRFETFLLHQGRLKAYDFQENHQKHELIEEGVVIPVLRGDSIGGGMNGPVYKVKVHEDHHRFHPNRREDFALKTIIRSASVPHKEHESEILTTLAEVPHDNLTPMLASWSQGLRCSILMPLALLNLFDFINGTLPPTLDGSFIIWFFQQIHGLAAAVDHIHHLGPSKLGPSMDRAKADGHHGSAGYHHDLKPKNILLFPGGVLKVSDFGTARLQQEITVIGSHKTPNLHCDPEYAAPDLVLTGHASRPHDIWALGCILLEMLVWAFGEEGEVDKFMDERNPRDAAVSTASFWHKTMEGAELKQAVRARMTSLRQHGQFKGVFFDLIELIESMLSVSIAKRPLIETVRSRLEKMIRQAQLDLDREGERYFLDSTDSRSRASKRTFGAPSIAGSDYEDERGHSRAQHLVAPHAGLRRHSMGQIYLAPRSVADAFPQLSKTNGAEHVVLSGQQFQTSKAQDRSEDGILTRSTTPTTPPKTPNTPVITTIDFDLQKLQTDSSPRTVSEYEPGCGSPRTPREQMAEAQ